MATTTETIASANATPHTSAHLNGQGAAAPAAFTQARPRTLASRLLLGFAATLVVALAAHVAIPLPWTPVPLTLQPLAVLLAGLALGPLDGFLAMAAYLAEGASGLPVFAPTGPGGLAQLLGPTGGFLLAYPIVAALAGGLTRLLSLKLASLRIPSFAAAFLGCTVAIAVLFAGGASWFAVLTHLPAHAVWIDTIAPYLPGELIKIVIAAGLYRALSRFVR